MTEKMRKPIARLLLTYFAVLTIPILISVFAFQSAYQAIENSTRSSMAAALQQTSAALEQRISEARRLGFTRCIVSAHSLKQLKRTPSGMEVVGVRTLQQAAKAAFAGGDTRSS